MSPTFRHQYSLFWKSLMTFDNATLKEVVKNWGVTNAEIFASATLMKPYGGGENQVSKKLKEISSEKDKKKRQYEMQQTSSEHRSTANSCAGDGLNERR